MKQTPDAIGGSVQRLVRRQGRARANRVDALRQEQLHLRTL